MIFLVSTATICAFLIILTVVMITKNQPEKQKNELMRLSETMVTAVFAVLLIALSYFILYMKFAQPDIAGGGLTSFLYVSGFAALCTLLGCGIMFYTFLRKFIVYSDGVVYLNLFGKKKKLLWKDIVEIKVPPLTNKATLIGASSKFTVGGEPKTYKKFLKIAKANVRPEVGSDILENLINRALI